MAVYTTVTPEDLAAWLTRYAIGAVREFDPIAAGIENTNYFVTADNGRFVLTLYERTPPEELPFYLNLMAHLARSGVKAPAPEPDTIVGQSARNRFAGIVTRVVKDKVAAQVEIQAGPHRLVSLMTREAADDLRLAPGVLAVAAVKATNVVVELPG